MKYLFLILTFIPALIWAKNDFTTEFLDKIDGRNYLITRNYDHDPWEYFCDQEFGATKGKVSIPINKKEKSIRFFFIMMPDHPFYKITKIVKVNNYKYIAYFQNEANFFFNIEFKDNGISYWTFHSPVMDEDSDSFQDQSFEMITYKDKPQIKIISKCRD